MTSSFLRRLERKFSSPGVPTSRSRLREAANGLKAFADSGVDADGSMSLSANIGDNGPDSGPGTDISSRAGTGLCGDNDGINTGDATCDSARGGLRTVSSHGGGIEFLGGHRTRDDKDG